jgi:hypothetical protein
MCVFRYEDANELFVRLMYVTIAIDIHRPPSGEKSRHA